MKEFKFNDNDYNANVANRCVVKNKMTWKIFILISLLLSGCSWPILRALPIIGESYESPTWDTVPEVTDPAFKATIEKVLGANFTEHNKIQTYVNGDEIFPAMIKTIRGAKEYIYLESYIVWEGDVARELAEALANRARDGVRVQALFDWHGSQEVGRKFEKLLKDAGVELKFYHPLSWYNPFSWKDVGNLDNRTHRRILVVDGVAAFTGGAGFADEWKGDARNKNEWRDNHYKLEGPAVQFMSGVFSENWWSAGGKFSFDRSIETKQSNGPLMVQVARSSPGTAIPAGITTFSAAIEAARKSIKISTPYFVPEELLLKKLVEASKRGVLVELIVPGTSSDNAVVRTASRGMWGALLKSGIKIFEFNTSLYHCKVLVVDDEFVTIGTSNWDARSLRLNDEVIVNVLGRSFAEEQKSIFEADKSVSKEITYEQWRDRPIWERFIDGISGATRDEL